MGQRKKRHGTSQHAALVNRKLIEIKAGIEKAFVILGLQYRWSCSEIRFTDIIFYPENLILLSSWVHICRIVQLFSPDLLTLI